MGLTEKFKENSCKLILYVINETLHSYVNIKCLGFLFYFVLFFSSLLLSPPLPDLHGAVFVREEGGRAGMGTCPLGRKN